MTNLNWNCGDDELNRLKRTLADRAASLIDEEVIQNFVDENVGEALKQYMKEGFFEVYPDLSLVFSVDEVVAYPDESELQRIISIPGLITKLSVIAEWDSDECDEAASALEALAKKLRAKAKKGKKAAA